MRLILSGRHPRNSTYATESGQVLYKVNKPYELWPGTATIKKAVGTVQGVWQGDDDQLRSPASASLPPIPARGSQIKPTPQFASESVSRRPSADESSDPVLLEGARERRSDSVDDETFAISDADEADSPEEVRAGSLPVYEGHFAFYAQIEFKTLLSSRFRFDSRDVSVKEYFRKEGWSWYGRGRVFTARDGKEYRWELRATCLVMISNDDSKTQLVRYKPYWPGLGAISKPRKASLEINDSCTGILDEIIMTFIYCHKLRKDRQRQTWSSGGRDVMRNH